MAAATLAVVLAGCGSDDTDTTSAATATSAAVATGGAVGPYGSAPASTPTGEAVPGSTGAPAAAATITIDGFKFSPANAKFKVGQTVTVVNNDTAPHSWTSSDGGFDTGILKAGGGKTTVTLSKAGTFDVVCTLHPTMTGTVTVEP